MTPTPLRIGVLASGRGSNLQAILDAAQAGKIRSRVHVVVSDQPQAGALDRARAAGTDAREILPDAALHGPERKRAHERAIHDALSRHEVDLVVLAGYMRIVTPWLIRHYPQRIINVHPALLPSFPGLHAQKQALDWGAKLAGCTTHFVDEKTDHGPIILQAAVAVHANDDEDALSRRILQLEHQLLPRTVHLIEQGRVHVDGRRVAIDPDASWRDRYPVVAGALYPAAY